MFSLGGHVFVLRFQFFKIRFVSFFFCFYQVLIFSFWQWFFNSTSVLSSWPLLPFFVQQRFLLSLFVVIFEHHLALVKGRSKAIHSICRVGAMAPWGGFLSHLLLVANVGSSYFLAKCRSSGFWWLKWLVLVVFLSHYIAAWLFGLRVFFSGGVEASELALREAERERDEIDREKEELELWLGTWWKIATCCNWKKTWWTLPDPKSLCLKFFLKMKHFGPETNDLDNLGRKSLDNGSQLGLSPPKPWGKRNNGKSRSSRSWRWGIWCHRPFLCTKHLIFRLGADGLDGRLRWLMSWPSPKIQSTYLLLLNQNAKNRYKTWNTI